MFIVGQLIATDPIVRIVEKEEPVAADNVAHNPFVSGFRVIIGGTVQRNKLKMRAIRRSLNTDAKAVFVDDQFCRGLL